MALNREVAERLLTKLEDLQKQIDVIHCELVDSMDNDELSQEELHEVKAIRKENDYRTLEEWTTSDENDEK